MREQNNGERHWWPSVTGLLGRRKDEKARRKESVTELRQRTSKALLQGSALLFVAKFFEWIFGSGEFLG
jgi:hypothetical protein